jgi:hypothetical protein
LRSATRNVNSGQGKTWRWRWRSPRQLKKKESHAPPPPLRQSLSAQLALAPHPMPVSQRRMDGLQLAGGSRLSEAAFEDWGAGRCGWCRPVRRCHADVG